MHRYWNPYAPHTVVYGWTLLAILPLSFRVSDSLHPVGVVRGVLEQRTPSGSVLRVGRRACDNLVPSMRGVQKPWSCSPIA